MFCIVGRDVRRHTNYTYFYLCITSTCIPFFRDVVFACCQKFLASQLDFSYTTLAVRRFRLFVCASQDCLRSGTCLLPLQILNCLRAHFLLIIFLLHHILVGYSKISFYGRLNLDPFSCIFETFTIVFF